MLKSHKYRRGTDLRTCSYIKAIQRETMRNVDDASQRRKGGIGEGRESRSE